jgi:hypothetical protein
MNTESIVAQLFISEMVCQANLDGIDHEESLMAPDGGGNCLNWVLGHLVKARRDVLALLGQPQTAANANFDRYAQGAPPLVDPSEAVAFPVILEQFRALRGPLVAAIQATPPEALTAPIPNSPTGNPNETVGSLLAAVAFHEAYHLGQAGLLRRMLGKQRNLP